MNIGISTKTLYAKEGNIRMNQNQMAELFATSKQSISYHITNILEDRELDEKSVVKDYLTTAADGKNYQVTFYALDMVLAAKLKCVPTVCCCVEDRLYW